jgi:RimJ/RimL family protein N-acetyltransferase
VDVRAGQLVLHPLGIDEAERVLRRQRLPGEQWATGYPSFEQIDYLEAYLVEARSPHPERYWQAQLRRRIDGLVVGGAGVTGPPDAEGAVVIGYELAAGLSDELYGIDIVTALVGVAREMKAARVTATIFDDDVIRRQVYLGAGLNEVHRDGRVVHLGRYI